MSDSELETRVTALTLALAGLLDGVSEEIMARAMDRYPDILLAELRKLVARADVCGPAGAIRPMSPSLALLQAMVEQAEGRKRMAEGVVGEIESYLATPMRDDVSTDEAEKRGSLADLLRTLRVA